MQPLLDTIFASIILTGIMDNIRVGLGQIDVTVGDLDGNLRKILKYIELAKKLGVNILCFPELAITGYPPEDLLLKPSFIEDNLEALAKVSNATEGVTLIVGFVDRKEDIYNAAAIIHNKKLVDVYHKRYLPNYGVFDENRYFQSGYRAPVYKLGGVIFGVNVCEDIWYPGDPTREQALLGDAQIIINISSSPYYVSKVKSRERMLSVRASDYSVIVVFCNLIGGQDELVFDGHSVVIGEGGDIIARAPGFKEELLVADISPSRVFRSSLHDPRKRKEKQALWRESKQAEVIEITEEEPLRNSRPRIAPKVEEILRPEEEVFRALVLGTRDYVTKNGFKKVVIGLSGGIDSSLVAGIAVEALGKENVIGVSMPSRYTSSGSITDAEKLSGNLGIELITVPIEKSFSAYLDLFTQAFSGKKQDVTEENLQARIRGNILMALSNKFGWLVLTTGNKSETSVGYCTLYGDMAGGFAVIKDVPKTFVYRIAEFYNNWKGKEIIPKTVLEKPPSAELRPNQKDTDSLPPYEILDPILKAYVEDDLSIEEIIALGFDENVVKRVIKLVDSNEYKRRQAAPGIKITVRAFGKDRRFPITNLYRG
ncbi:MAG: NH(3)-dependent NAD(+) synthetase, NAD+ synthase (glutamine-hydrolysing) [Candidatus Dadabacteria bacterium CSP1-2]|nr:MAG: NH(3)-dependent NAD(+) synthetase, NAD+ synthase (glutamine-hydrolysing) [Candidatus Dadabacteria bacterium CSP1-2]